MLIHPDMLAELKSCCKDDAAFERMRMLLETRFSACNEVESMLQHTVEVLQGEVRERIQVEEELVAQEQFYRSLFENANIGLAFKKNSKIVRANRAYVEMLGYTADEIAQKSLADITHPDDLPKQLALNAQLERGEISQYSIVKRYIRKDGSVIWAEASVSAVKDKRGEPLKIVAMRDVSQEILAQEKIRYSEAQLAWLLNALPFAIAIYKNKVPIFGNRAFYESRGLRDMAHWLESKTQESSIDDYALIHPDDHNAFIANIDEYRARVEQGELLKTERRIRRYGETEYLWYECSIFKGDYIGGEKVVVEVDIPIEDRKRAELESLKVQRLLSETERLAKIGSWAMNFEAETIAWSDEVFRIYEREKSLGALSYNDMFQISPDASMIMPIIKDATEKGIGFSVELRLAFAENRTKWVEVIGRPVRDEQGVLCGYGGYVRDITHEKKMEAEQELLYAQLLQSQKMESIGVLASGVAHEFNNILAGILGATTLLKKEVAGNPKGEKRVAQIETASHRAATIVKQMLGFARKGKINVQTIDLRECIKNVLNIVEPTLDKRIVVKTDFQVDNATAFIEGDAGQLEQVILNLVVNARDALLETTPAIDSPKISFILTSEPLPKNLAAESSLPSEMKMLHLAVCDNGIGIPKAIQAKIFEPFFTTKEVGKGTGLGLSMVYGIVKNHQGFISVESTVGEGTTFHLYFPISKKRNIQIHVEENPNVIGAVKGTILVIDDEPFIREFLTEILEENGYLVYAESNGKDGFSFFEAHRDEIDLVVTDRNMPELDGERLLLKLKEVRPTLPVILITGNIENDLTDKIEQSGAHKVLRKPFDSEELLSTISHALRAS
ncbi:MAG: PAS domain S-box protein [Chloroherpetonaceae bacterium]